MAADPLTHAKEILAAHAKDPRARMFKLDTSLLAMHQALAEIERRQGNLAAAYLVLLESVLDGRKLTMHPAALDELAGMSFHARDIVGRIRARVCGG